MNHLSFIFLFFLITSVANSQDYYVDDQGNDSNPGSESSPFRTINKAIEYVEAGGTIYVMDGIYRNENAGVPLVSFYEDSSQKDSANNNYVYSNGENLNNPHVVTINKAGNETDGYITLKIIQTTVPKLFSMDKVALSLVQMQIMLLLKALRLGTLAVNHIRSGDYESQK